MSLMSRVLVAVAVMLCSTFATAQCVNGPGALDTTFGNQGTFSFGISPGLSPAIVDPDGHIVMAGSNDAGQAVVMRVGPTGTVDWTRTFPSLTSAAQGIVIQTVANNAPVVPQVIAVVGAPTSFNNVSYNAEALRLDLQTGNQDITFGNNGTGLAFVPGVSGPVGAGLTSEGKVVLGGGVWAARLNSDGTLDTSFGSGGVFTWSGPVDFIKGVWLDPSGRMLLAGRLTTGRKGATAIFDSFLLRVSASGTLDSSFGPNSHPGYVAVDYVYGNEFFTGVIAYEDGSGKILASGRTAMAVNNDTSAWTVTRLNEDGSPDVTFGSNSNGKVVFDPSVVDNFVGAFDNATGVTFDSVGHVLLVGTTSVVTGTVKGKPTGYNALALARFTSNGLLDGGFGCGQGYVVNKGGVLGMRATVFHNPNAAVGTEDVLAFDYKGFAFAVAD